LKLHLKIALLVGVLALAAAPAAAPAAQPAEPGNGHKPAEPGNGHKPAEPAGGHVPAEPGNGQGAAKPGNGPEYSPAPPTTKAFGYYCRTEKRTHEAGVPGTPFSKCVKAHAQAAAHPHMSARRACKALIEKHVPKSDKKGTAFSRCVVGVNEERKKEREATA
jgi:hypothetical protein